jgi:Holin of 3TMs, for gene-transfer release
MAKERDSTEWMQKLWRPAMGWMYMLICLLDMAVFPVLWSLLQATMHMPITQWNPLTLQGAGLFHIAMGAVLGISAFGRTQEKLAGTAANPTTTQTITQNTNMPGMAGGFGNGSTTGFSSGAPAFGAPTTGGFGASSTSFTPAPSWGTTPVATNSTGFGTTSSTPVSTGFGGKKVVPDFPQPII